MTSQNILYIEASKADYKEQLEEKKPRSWLKSVSAFANTHGGHLILASRMSRGLWWALRTRRPSSARRPN